MTGTYGGGAFVVIYLLCILLLGLPLMMTEIMLGRRGRHSPINSLRHLTQESQCSRLWVGVGWMGVITGVLILSFYSVVAGWSLAYMVKLLNGNFSLLGQMPSTELNTFAQQEFVSLISDPYALTLWHTVFMVVTIGVAAAGLKSGLERAINYLMPLLFLLLIVLVGYAATTPAFTQGLQFLFYVDFEAFFYPNCTANQCELSSKGLLAALGQAFFTLSLGMGCIMAYGAYVPSNASITQTTLAIVFADTVVAILAGIAIFPIVFSNHLAPAEGVGLVFFSLPLAFGQMPGGIVIGTLFFLLLAVAAWTSAFSLVEPSAAWLVETQRFSRRTATALLGVIVWLFGFLTVFSFNIWQDFKPLAMFAFFADKTLFDLLDFLTSNVLLPLGGLLLAVFAGWFMQRQYSAAELGLTPSGFGYRVWLFLMRFVVPVGVFVILLKALLMGAA
jgi:NSS family neurotransmitter:Na+ symporter